MTLCLRRWKFWNSSMIFTSVALRAGVPLVSRDSSLAPFSLSRRYYLRSGQEDGRGGKYTGKCKSSSHFVIVTCGWKIQLHCALNQKWRRKKTSPPLFVTPLSLFSVYHLHPSLPFSAYHMELNSLFSALHMDQWISYRGESNEKKRESSFDNDHEGIGGGEKEGLHPLDRSFKRLWTQIQSRFIGYMI